MFFICKPHVFGPYHWLTNPSTTPCVAASRAVRLGRGVSQVQASRLSGTASVSTEFIIVSKEGDAGTVGMITLNRPKGGCLGSAGASVHQA